MSLLFTASLGLALADSQCTPKILPTDALIIIDVQNSFMEERSITPYVTPQYPIPANETSNSKIPAGSLAVTGSSDIVPVLNTWIEAFQKAGAPIFASLDWHPRGHCSFCSDDKICIEGEATCSNTTCPSSAETRCQDEVAIHDWKANDYVQWPIHCPQTEFGARFDPYLLIPNNTVVVKKGWNYTGDSYSAFGGVESPQGYPFDTEDRTDKSDPSAPPFGGRRELKALIEAHKVQRLFVTGLATDFCVQHTSLDSIGYEYPELRPSTLTQTILLLSASRGVSNDTTTTAIKLMKEQGISVMSPEYVNPQATLQALCKEADESHDSSSSLYGFSINGWFFVCLAMALCLCFKLYSRREKEGDRYNSLQ